jgi:hypothetical protein
MAREAVKTTPARTVADIQFAGTRGRKIAWRSRPAAELTRRDPAAVERRLEKGLLLDGIR